MQQKYSTISFLVLLMVLGLVLLLHTFDPIYDGGGFGTEFGPSFYPRIVLIIWSIFSGALIIREFTTATVLENTNWKQFVLVVTSSIFFAYLMSIIGFVFAMIPGFAVVAWQFGYRRPVPLGATAVILPLVIWFAFVKFFKLGLPTSVWFPGVI